MTSRTLFSLLTAAPAADPAVVWRGETMSFGDLAVSARQFGRAASVAGEAGQIVAIVGDNSPEYLACLYGVPEAGRVVTMLNQRLAPAEMVAQLEDSGAVAVWGDEQYLAPLADRLSPSVASCHSFAEVVHHGSTGDQDEERPAPAADAVAQLIYTSGTTGRAKGAMLTHESLLAAVESSVSGRPVRDDDVYLFPFSLCHVAGYNVFIQHRFGRPVVLVPGFDAAEVLDLAPRYGVTTMSLAPTMMTMLLDHPDFVASKLASLRLVGYGSAPISEALLRRWLHTLDAGVSQGYGMTELSGNAVFLTAEDHREAIGDRPELLQAAGRAASGVELRIAGDGEILVRSAQVMAGYWKQPDASADTVVDGWLHTGDVGHVDDAGYLYVSDRKKDIIVTGGENVSSREVEDAVRSAPGVRDAACVGVPDDRWGEAICAVVIADEPVDEATIVDHVRTVVASYKKPKHVLAIDELPRNGTGKVLKRELRDWAAQVIEAQR